MGTKTKGLNIVRARLKLNHETSELEVENETSAATIAIQHCFSHSMTHVSQLKITPITKKSRCDHEKTHDVTKSSCKYHDLKLSYTVI